MAATSSTPDRPIRCYFYRTHSQQDFAVVLAMQPRRELGQFLVRQGNRYEHGRHSKTTATEVVKGAILIFSK